MERPGRFEGDSILQMAILFAFFHDWNKKRGIGEPRGICAFDRVFSGE
jgi:hypothetical protein